MKKQPCADTPQERLTVIFLKCRSLISRAVGRVAKPHDIEDIVQETFIRCFEAASKQPIRHPRSFMLTTARNLAINHVMRSESRLTETVEDFDALDVYVSTDNVESSVDAKQKFLLFCRAVRTLPLQCRRAFLLKKVYGFSQKEIAGFLGLSESTVEKHIGKGLLLCADYMDEHSPELPARLTSRAIRKTGSTGNE
jgi:RNA polymerase sigma factor (sigma-70 family)